MHVMSLLFEVLDLNFRQNVERMHRKTSDKIWR